MSNKQVKIARSLPLAGTFKKRRFALLFKSPLLKSLYVKMNNYIQLMILCFFLAIVVNYITHKAKSINRKKYAVLVLGVISGFVSFVISLILLTAYPENWILIGSLVSIIYSFTMANAKGFNFIK